MPDGTASSQQEREEGCEGGESRRRTEKSERKLEPTRTVWTNSGLSLLPTCMTREPRCRSWHASLWSYAYPTQQSEKLKEEASWAAASKLDKLYLWKSSSGHELREQLPPHQPSCTKTQWLLLHFCFPKALSCV